MKEYSHTCNMNHAEIGYSEEERCPLCTIRSTIEQDFFDLVAEINSSIFSYRQLAKTRFTEGLEQVKELV